MGVWRLSKVFPEKKGGGGSSPENGGCGINLKTIKLLFPKDKKENCRIKNKLCSLILHSPIDFPPEKLSLLWK